MKYRVWPGAIAWMLPRDNCGRRILCEVLYLCETLSAKWGEPSWQVRVREPMEGIDADSGERIATTEGAWPDRLLQPIVPDPSGEKIAYPVEEEVR